MLLAPFPPRRAGRDGGARNIAHRLERLARDHGVSLVHLHQSADPPLEPELASVCSCVIAVDRTTSEGTLSLQRGLRGFPRLVWTAWRGIPFWAQAIASSVAEEATARLVADVAPNIIQVEYLVMGQSVPPGHGAATVLVVHAPAECIAENFAAHRGGPMRLLGFIDRRAWLRFERRVADASDQVVVFSTQDAAMVRTGGHSSRRTAPRTGLHVPGSPREIFPRVRIAHPAARFWIVGESPPRELAELASDRVEVTGGVPRVEPWLERAAVFAAPICSGGGMRVKVVEALAAGKAIVCTSRAIAGIGLTGDEVRVAETAEALADEIITLLGDSKRRGALARAARAWADGALVRDAEARAYEDIYERPLSERNDDRRRETLNESTTVSPVAEE